MAQKQSSDTQKQQQQRSAKEREQDIKNAEYIASVDRPNHPNT